MHVCIYIYMCMETQYVKIHACIYIYSYIHPWGCIRCFIGFCKDLPCRMRCQAFLCVSLDPWHGQGQWIACKWRLDTYIYICLNNYRCRSEESLRNMISDTLAILPMNMGI